jgi:uncharacterized delta-60 repeat protein
MDMNLTFPRLVAATAATLALACGAGAAQAAPGVLDPTFGSGGIALNSTGVSEFRGLDVQPDGKVVALETGNDTAAYQRVLRFAPDGTPDASFGNGGIAAPLSAPAFWVRALALAPDGKILVAGYDSAYDYALARLMPDGKLDPGFDGDSGIANGIVHTALTPGTDMPIAVTVDKQGRIVVAGKAGGSDIGIARYLPDGKLDKSLAGDGTIVDVTPASEAVSSVATVDGGIIVAGGIGSDAFAAAYTEQGAVASGFGQSGRRIIHANAGESDWAASIATQSDGTIILGVGVSQLWVVLPDRLVALTPGGAIDAGFANGGSVQLNDNLYVNNIAVAGDDKILATGYGELDDDYASALERRNADGTPDMSFGGGAPVLVRSPHESSSNTDYVAVATDGKILTAGVGYDPVAQTNELAIQRFQGADDPPSNPGGTGATGPATQPQVVPGPLTLSNLRITRRTVSARSTSQRKRGTAFVFTLNRAATVTVRIKRLHHAAKVVKLKRASRAGANRIRFKARSGRHALRPGRYRATLIAADAAGARSKARAVTFGIL